MMIVISCIIIIEFDGRLSTEDFRFVVFLINVVYFHTAV
jgi:hypothetical protein